MEGNTTRPGQFLEWTQQVGLEAVGPLLARGSAVADYDNDGDLDIAINTIGGAAALLQSQGQTSNWLQVAVDGFYPGTTAEVELPAGHRLLRELYSGSSYLASESPRLHFGLGRADRAGRLGVTLPDGRQLTFRDVPANQIFQVSTEG